MSAFTSSHLHQRVEGAEGSQIDSFFEKCLPFRRFLIHQFIDSFSDPSQRSHKENDFTSDMEILEMFGKHIPPSKNAILPPSKSKGKPEKKDEIPSEKSPPLIISQNPPFLPLSLSQKFNLTLTPSSPKERPKISIIYRFPERLLWHIYKFDPKNIRLNEICRFTNLSLRQFDNLNYEKMSLFNRFSKISPSLWARKYHNIKILRVFGTHELTRQFINSLPENCPKLETFELRAHMAHKKKQK